MIEQRMWKTQRLEIACYQGGTAGAPKLLLLHGNASSSKFYLPLMERLEGRFELAAPDLRCFGDSQPMPVNAARGLRDFSDDIYALTQTMGWDRFYLLGWSMGGGVAMQYAIDHSEQLLGLILEAPLSPFGFGGTCTPDGRMLTPAGLASGGGCANAQLVQALQAGNREFMRTMLNNVYLYPGFRVEPKWEEQFVDAIASTRVGDGMYPGDSVSVTQWPGVASGSRGVCNTMSPVYCNLSALTDIPHKCPVLWLRGDSDLVVGDHSPCDFGALGEMGAVPGWPGPELFPPQPMVAQTRYVLDQYAAKGGSYQEILLEHSGHACHVDQEDKFLKSLMDFVFSRKE